MILDNLPVTTYDLEDGVSAVFYFDVLCLLMPFCAGFCEV